MVRISRKEGEALVLYAVEPAESVSIGPDLIEILLSLTMSQEKQDKKEDSPPPPPPPQPDRPFKKGA